MILRRIIEHFRKQEWTAIVIDFVIVVMGVFVGMQVNDWNAARQETAQMRLYVKRLRADFSGIRARIDEHIKVFDDTADGADYLLSIIGANSPYTDENKVDRARLEKAFAALQSFRVPPPPAATYSEMVSEGQLSRLDSSALRDALADYDRLLGVVQEVSRTVNALFVAQSPVLDRHIVGRTVADPHALSGIMEEVISYDLAGMRSDRDFAVAVTALRRGALDSLAQRKLQLRLIDKIDALLNAEQPE